MTSKNDERPFATPDQEASARARFRFELSIEEFAARFGHEFAMFSFDRFRYRDPKMTAWIDELAAFFFAPKLPAHLRIVREKYLTPEEIAKVEEFERDPF